MSQLANNFARQICSLRSSQGLSQRALARISGIPNPTINRFERGKQEPSWEQLERLAEVLQCTVGELIGTEKQP